MLPRALHMMHLQLFPNVTLILKLNLSPKFRSETYKHPAFISVPFTQLTPQCWNSELHQVKTHRQDLNPCTTVCHMIQSFQEH